MKLILLEDDPLILVCTEDALTEAGFEVRSATTPSEALELLSDSPECVAMMVDVRLNDAIDGWEVARRARVIHPNIAIVYTTTADADAYQREGVGQSVLLQKPYTLDRAVKALREACEKVE